MGNNKVPSSHSIFSLPRNFLFIRIKKKERINKARLIPAKICHIEIRIGEIS
jgi:hypothetical protein